MCARAGDAGAAEGLRGGVRDQSAQEGRDHPGRRRGLHAHRAAHPHARRQAPVPHRSAFLVPDEGTHTRLTTHDSRLTTTSTRTHCLPTLLPSTRVTLSLPLPLRLLLPARLPSPSRCFAVN